ncbi:nucleotide sugar dehydrogenase [Desulfobacula phenolica]|uniref:UDP-N-acetyl-D-galactosamine dehydrogenase n=1 Tax=Desulfobacula phenolica TaxID=90732 RepID=A0A1H2EP50_9BACT|nr:nucleotide sugar dehydrogenase [Desulfobacula phenolica]SDT96518.1 UDP-N-acetyl-D-galactosamine dehydrogenase [Desulfobacula phenolica]
MDKNTKIAIIGLGYVGLPLAVHFAAKFHTIGLDLKESIIENCKKFKDPTGEVSRDEFEKAVYFFPTSDPSKISDADYIIVAVPTPIDTARRPDLKYMESSSQTAGKYMKKGAVVIFESTVYPGVTEEICVPILEKVSGYEWKKDFHVGYSPERINPGDKEHTLPKIVKVVSGDDEDTCDKVAMLYETIIEAGVHRTQTIKEAEAAKVIENTQRDLNIALMNELALIFDKFGIDTKNVLEAAGSKWNFLPFKPGLVGGHCIGVDPYYLTFKAESEGYHPQIILSGRRINDNMGRFVVEKTIKMMINQGLNVKDSKIGVLGLTFKEDCPDLRNTRVVDIIEELCSYGTNVLVHDAISDPKEALAYYNINLCDWDDLNELSALILAVPHKEYLKKNLSELKKMLLPGGCLIDVKSVFDPQEAKKMGINFWRL